MAYQRKTRDIFEIQGNYGYYGFDMVTTENTRKEARERLKEYKTNEPNTSFKIVRKREKISE